MTLKVISYGGGIQSTAMIVLATEGVVEFTDAVFANVGEDSEAQVTLDYIRNVVTPWAAERGVKVHEVRRIARNGEPFSTLLKYHKDNLDRTGATPLPVHMIGAGPGGIANRTCTRDWKAKPVTKWLKQNGATEDDPAHIAIGISTDEIHRVNNKHDKPWERRVFPLIDLGLSRTDCEAIIARSGLPVPPKSACWFCPFHGRAGFAKMRRDNPEQFEAVAQLEDEMLEARERHGKPAFYWTSKAQPMRDHVAAVQDSLPGFGATGPDTCDEGYCWT